MDLDVALLTLALSADEALPRDIRLLKYGENITSKGTFTLSSEQGAAVVARWSSRQTDFGWDYEHQTFQEPPIEAPASAWATLEAREDGVYSVNTDWTPRAAEKLAAKEYRYFSPALLFDRETREVTDLLNCALTNFPATHGLEPLVALSGRIRSLAGEVPGLQALGAASLALLRMSHGRLASLLQEAWNEGYGESKPYRWSYLRDVFDDAAVFRGENEHLWEIRYSQQGETVELIGEPIEVAHDYKPVSEPAMLTGVEEDAMGDDTTDSKIENQEVLTLRQELLQAQSRNAELEAEKLLLKHAAKITPPMRDHCRKMAIADAEGFEAFMATLPELPAGRLEQPKLDKDQPRRHSDLAMDVWKNQGLTKADVEKFGGLPTDRDSVANGS